MQTAGMNFQTGSSTAYWVCPLNPSTSTT
ncbi:MAG: hypothetical protein SPE12_10670 [Enterocloster aldenensis]|nr:hypothetical protein [Enterocloster aldenensis]